ncbi:hypothetical protein PBI_SCTP2_77 [Salicola phage SCTP-2]|nr:hypothetical protein PBI_SCTP2_77 [Salicola phage SCTP-2]
MTHEQAFQEYLGSPASGKKAFVIELAEGENNPFSKIAGGKITGRGRMIMKSNALYIEAESCSNNEAQELTV